MSQTENGHKVLVQLAEYEEDQAKLELAGPVDDQAVEDDVYAPLPGLSVKPLGVVEYASGPPNGGDGP